MFATSDIFASFVATGALLSGGLAQCSSGSCISVYTDPVTHQVVITAKQIAPGSTASPRPRPTHSYTPRPKPQTPKAKPTTTIIKPLVRYNYRPVTRPRPAPSATKRAKVKVLTAAITSAVNLSDQISQLLPGNHLLYQPNSEPLAQLPVYFWSDAGSIFSIATSILGIGVNVSLSPSFAWDFGDGSTFTTSDPGGPYPNKTVVHTYSHPGQYTTTLAISWAGSWAAQGSVLPVLGGAIVQQLSAQISIGPAPTHYTG